MTTPFINGIVASADNVLNFTAAAAAVANPGNKKSGQALTATLNLATVDATAGIPAGVVRVGGIAYTQDGRMCTSTNAPALSGTKIGGMAISVDGAVHIVTGAVSPATKVAGRAFDSLGRLRVVSN